MLHHNYKTFSNVEVGTDDTTLVLTGKSFRKFQELCLLIVTG